MFNYKDPWATPPKQHIIRRSDKTTTHKTWIRRKETNAKNIAPIFAATQLPHMLTQRNTYVCNNGNHHTSIVITHVCQNTMFHTWKLLVLADSIQLTNVGKTRKQINGGRSVLAIDLQKIEVQRLCMTNWLHSTERVLQKPHCGVQPNSTKDVKSGTS